MNNPEELSLRDYFVATVGTADLMAIRNPDDQETLLGEAFDTAWPIEKQISFNMKMEALLRYAYADAMMKEGASK